MTVENYALSYAVTDTIIGLAVEIGELVGLVTLKSEAAENLRLRRENQMRSVRSSLAIENFSLSPEQVGYVIDGKRVSAAPDGIREVKNAYGVYELMSELDPFSIGDMLSAHGALMAGLTEEAGKFRSGGVKTSAGERFVSTAPPAVIVPKLMYDLVRWAEASEAHPLIKSCVFHYEFEFIHPFADGNGRMGRMWQALMLSRWKPFFAWLPVETFIHERRKEYHDVLGVYEKAVDSTAFIEFMLSVIRDALREFLQAEQAPVQVTEQVGRLMAALGEETLSSREMMARLKLKHRPTFRDNYLLPALSFGLVEMTIPDKPNSSRQRYRAAISPAGKKGVR